MYICSYTDMFPPLPLSHDAINGTSTSTGTIFEFLNEKIIGVPELVTPIECVIQLGN